MKECCGNCENPDQAPDAQAALPQSTCQAGSTENMADLPARHPLRIMMAEHQRLLQYLNELKQVNWAIQKKTTWPEAEIEFNQLIHLAQILIGAEPHHQREEQVLFPALEKRGVMGPPHMMRVEHVELRRYKHQLLEIAQVKHALDFPACQTRLDATVHILTNLLQEHIFKEDHVLYPMALRCIQDAESWELISQECDLVGYCVFTPESVQAVAEAVS